MATGWLQDGYRMATGWFVVILVDESCGEIA